MQVEDLGGEDGFDEFSTPTKIALIDADTLVFASCSVCEYAEDVLPREMYNDEEWAEVINHPYYDEESQAIWNINETELLELAIDKIRTIQNLTDTKSVELYFTEGRNFRYEVEPMYKGNRKSSRYPTGLSWLKHELLELYPGKICTEWEADDEVVMLKRTQPNKYILVAVDKDVYKSVPGKYFNYYSSVKYGIDMKWGETSVEDAFKFSYIQTLMGDSTDNIKGCPGIGPKKAATALEGLYLPCDMWTAVVKMFKKKKLTTKDAIRDMRLVNMHQLTIDHKVQLWLPPCEGE